MKYADLFSLSTRMFRSRPARTWLTIFGISVGIGAVLFLVSLGYGLQNIILEKIVFNQAMLSLTVTPGNELIPFDKTAIAGLVAIPKVVDVAPLAKFTGQISIGELNGTVELRGVNAPFFDYSGTAPLAGFLYKEDEGSQVVVSEAILKLFGAKDPNEIVNKEISIKIFISSKSEQGVDNLEIINVPVKFRIKGVVRDGQDGFVYIPLQELEKYAAVHTFEQARVKVSNSDDMVLVKAAIIDGGYQVVSLSETIEQANKIFKIIQIVLGLFGAVALVVSSIGMFNTMTVTLMERTNEIGIMRALGASRKDVRNQFLSEAVIIGFFGGLVGMITGVIVSQFFNWIINGLATRFGGAKTDLFAYPFWFMMIIIFLSIIIGFFSGIFPARRAAKMEPLEALRYK